MGLDMYLTGNRHILNARSGSMRKKSESYDLGYWRKHQKLHNYIVQKFANGVDDCEEIELSLDDLREIRRAVQNPNIMGADNPEEATGDETHDLTQLLQATAWLLEKDDEAYRSVNYQASW